jgi:CHAP domain
MSLQAVVARIAEINQINSPRPPAASTTTGTSGFLATLGGVQSSSALSTTSPMTLGAGTAGQRALAAAQAEVGVAEQPPGSNDSPRIAQYRQATAGAPGPGPWCAYFVSWAARTAGVPIGDSGQGYGRVDDVWAWGERSGKAIPASAGPPQPGDLIVWDEHIGIVESVGPDGSINTIEGNSSDRVSRRTYGSDGGGAIGYVRLG